MSHEQTCKQTIQSYLDQLSAIGLYLGRTRLGLFEKNSSKSVYEKLAEFQNVSDDDRPQLEVLDVRTEGDRILVEASGGETYFLKEISGKWKIVDIELPCDCSGHEDIDPGDCPVCQGSGKLGDDGCEECEGGGKCRECTGLGMVSLGKALAAHPHDHGGEDENAHVPFADLDAFMAEYLDDSATELTRAVAGFGWELDRVFFKYCEDMKALYEEYFSTADIRYPEILFPMYVRPMMSMPDEDMEDDKAEVHNLQVAEDEFLLTVQDAGSGRIRITEVQVPCELEAHPLFQPHDEPVPCNCMESDGVPEEDCLACKGTGIIVCPICLGMGWMEIAPDPLTTDEMEDSERYRQIVPALYEMEDEED